MANPTDIFIGYAHGYRNNENRAETLRRDIVNYMRKNVRLDLEIFIDKLHCVPIGTIGWQEYAAQAIDEAIIYIAMVDNGFFEASGCLFEINVIGDRENEKKRHHPITIFTVRSKTFPFEHYQERYEAAKDLWLGSKSDRTRKSLYTPEDQLEVEFYFAWKRLMKDARHTFIWDDDSTVNVRSICEAILRIF